MTEDSTITRSNGQFNRAAFKRHAIKVSNTVRQGKFTRVSESFINDVQAEIENAIRRLTAEVGNSPFGQVNPDPLNEFLTGAGKKRLCEAFNVFIASEIHRQSNKVRTGVTL
jgi:hypothetical protein